MSSYVQQAVLKLLTALRHGTEAFGDHAAFQGVLMGRYSSNKTFVVLRLGNIGSLSSGLHSD